MNRSELDAYVLDCLRKDEQVRALRDSKRSWDVLGNGRFKCRLCNKVRGDHLRSAVRVGFCKLCNGE